MFSNDEWGKRILHGYPYADMLLCTQKVQYRGDQSNNRLLLEVLKRPSRLHSRYL